MNKEIMEIIQPYTDKTLREGCYIEKTSPTGVIYLEKIIGLRNDDNSYPIRFNPKTTLTRDNETFNYWEGKSYIKILGHYDITAVLKYIEKENPNDDMISIDTDGEYFFMNTYKYFFPNKPLHLYTEQENKDLLELLKELG